MNENFPWENDDEDEDGPHSPEEEKAMEAKVLINYGEFGKALQILDTVASDDTDDPQLLTLKAICLVQLSLPDRAHSALDKLEYLAPEWNGLNYYRALNLDNEDKPAEALVAIDKALEQDSSDSDFYFAQARFYLQLSRRADAADAFIYTLALNKEHYWAHYLQCHNYLEQEQITEAELALKEFEQAFPDSAGVQEVRAQLLIRQGRYSEAQSNLHLAFEQNSEQQEIRNSLLFTMRQQTWFFAGARQVNKQTAGRKWISLLLVVAVFIILRLQASQTEDSPFASFTLSTVIQIYLLFVAFTYLFAPLADAYLYIKSETARELLPWRNAVGGLAALGLLTIGVLVSVTGYFSDNSPAVACGFMTAALSIPISGLISVWHLPDHQFKLRLGFCILLTGCLFVYALFPNAQSVSNAVLAIFYVGLLAASWFGALRP